MSNGAAPRCSCHPEGMLLSLRLCLRGPSQGDTRALVATTRPTGGRLWVVSSPRDASDVLHDDQTTSDRFRALCSEGEPP